MCEKCIVGCNRDRPAWWGFLGVDERNHLQSVVIMRHNDYSYLSSSFQTLSGVRRASFPSNANLAFHPSGVGKWVPASAGMAKADMVHSVSGWTRGVQVGLKLWDPLRTRAIPERLRGEITTWRYTNPRSPLTLPFRDLGTIRTTISVGSHPKPRRYSLRQL